jgi:hypothetical protein
VVEAAGGKQILFFPARYDGKASGERLGGCDRVPAVGGNQPM